MRNVSVRGAHEDDLPRVAELLRECVAGMHARGIDQWDEAYPTAVTLAADIRARALYVASTEQRPVAGAFALGERQEPEYAAVPWTVGASRVCVLHRLMVHPSCQARGLGPLLMRFAEARARRLGYEAMRLDAFTGELAIAAPLRGPRLSRRGRRHVQHGPVPLLRKGAERVSRA